MQSYCRHSPQFAVSIRVEALPGDGLQVTDHVSPLYTSLLNAINDYRLIVSAALISQELDNLSEWAGVNNLKLNMGKCCEMVVYLQNADWLKVFPRGMGFTGVEFLIAVGINLTTPCLLSRMSLKWRVSLRIEDAWLTRSGLIDVT